ncbi:MAG TPA: aquaporin [Phycisphaerales bacterium]|jgi:aquaporin Z|nr:aquaporin [Phycisphaerales bacterium]
MNKLLTELIGTFFLVFGIATIVPTNSPIAPLIIGLGLAVMVYMGGPVSGAHYNPAVTLAVWLRGKISPNEALAYMAVQIVGALAGAAAGLVLLNKTVAIAPGPGVHIGIALLSEVIFTFALALVVLNVATTKQTANNSYYGFAIGMTVAVGAATVGPLSGGAFNPAVGLGLTIIATLKGAGLAHVWLYIVGPFAGAILAAMAFRAQHGTAAD